MAIEYWELQQRHKGNAAAAEMAKTLRDQFGDVPLPVNEVSVESKRFSPDLAKSLESKGFKIYTLSGQSVRSEREAGRKFWSTWHKDYSQFEALTSIHSEVAIDPDPDKFFIPKSNNEKLDRQLEMVAHHSKKLQKSITSEVQAVMGQAPDYVDLTFTHLDVVKNMKDRLFGEKYGYNWARTQTPTVGSRVADVGHFVADNGLNVSHWHRGRGDVDVFAAPLVVPKY